MWPFCRQPLYAQAMPLMFNATVLNGMGLIGAPLTYMALGMKEAPIVSLLSLPCSELYTVGLAP